MTSTDFRALCEELTTTLEYTWDGRRPKVIQELIERARAALAQPEPVVDDDFVTAVNDLAKRTHKSKAEVLRDAINLYYKAVNEWVGAVAHQSVCTHPLAPTNALPTPEAND